MFFLFALFAFLPPTAGPIGDGAFIAGIFIAGIEGIFATGIEGIFIEGALILGTTEETFGINEDSVEGTISETVFVEGRIDGISYIFGVSTYLGVFMYRVLYGS